jgi:RNA polymerase sigma-70 factor (ECF subfamily)
LSHDLAPHAARNQEEFLKLYATAQPALQHFLAAHIPDLDEVDDLMQEVAVCLWKKFDQFSPGTSFRGWAIRVAHYEILHARRAHARGRTVLSPRLSDETATRCERIDIAGSEARRKALQRCLDELPGEQRALILARYRSGRSGQDLAKQSGKSENQLYVQMFRIREALRRCVDGTLASSGGSTEVTA